MMHIEFVGDSRLQYRKINHCYYANIRETHLFPRRPIQTQWNFLIVIKVDTHSFYFLS